MSRKRHKKRYPGRGRRLGPIRTGKQHSSPPAVIIKSSRKRWDVASDNGAVSGGRMGNRPVPWGNNDGYVNVDVIGSHDNGETHKLIKAKRAKTVFTIPFGKPDMSDEPYGTIYGEDGEILFQGKAKLVYGYAQEIMAFIRWLEGDTAGPWTRRPFIITKSGNGEYFFKEVARKINGKWTKTPLEKGDTVVRPGQFGWEVEKFEQLRKSEEYRTISNSGKPGMAADKARENAYDTGMDVESRMQMSDAFEKFINSR